MPAKCTWTDERVAELKRLWQDGQTATQIGKIFGCTRNAVLGKLHRLNGAARRNGLKRGQTGKPRIWRPVPKKKPPKPLPEPQPEPEALAIPMLKVRRKRRHNGRYYKVMEAVLTDHTCKWPVAGEGAETKFCGHKSESGSRYCTRHMLDSVHPDYRAKLARRRAA